MPQLKTQYQMVYDFNVAFGVYIYSPFNSELILKHDTLANLRYSLIEEEVLELQEAIRTNDNKETIDALADILYVGWGAGVSFGIDMDQEYKQYLELLHTPYYTFDFENKSNFENTRIVPNTTITKEN